VTASTETYLVTCVKCGAPIVRASHLADQELRTMRTHLRACQREIAVTTSDDAGAVLSHFVVRTIGTSS
jgi:hypothetical protein